MTIPLYNILPFLTVITFFVLLFFTTSVIEYFALGLVVHSRSNFLFSNLESHVSFQSCARIFNKNASIIVKVIRCGKSQVESLGISIS